MTLRSVPPLELLTAQELIYLAAGVRGMAEQARAEASKQTSPAAREPFEQAERVYRALAAKCERMAALMQKLGL